MFTSTRYAIILWDAWSSRTKANTLLGSQLHNMVGPQRTHRNNYDEKKASYWDKETSYETGAQHGAQAFGIPYSTTQFSSRRAGFNLSQQRPLQPPTRLTHPLPDRPSNGLQAQSALSIHGPSEFFTSAQPPQLPRGPVNPVPSIPTPLPAVHQLNLHSSSVTPNQAVQPSLQSS